MALTKLDVLRTLDDPIVGRMDFWVGNVHVHAAAYANIRKLIDTEDIEVIEGTNAANAYYNAQDDTLTTQNVNSPADLGARSLLLHECTHALVDLAEIEVTRLTDEATAYIAQHAYKLLSNPYWVVPPNNLPWETFFKHVVALVKAFRLDTTMGRGARLQWHDYESLRTELNRLNIYTDVEDDELTFSNGVKVGQRGTGFGSRSQGS